MSFEDLDQVDTPKPIARLIAEELGSLRGGRVFDPTVGEGALLLAVREVHGAETTFVGADIDLGRVERLRQAEPSWIVSATNALDDESRAQSDAWRAVGEGCEAVVFNPPFSFRGNEGIRVTLESKELTISPATAFVAVALRQANPDGAMVGVLPAGSFANSRDLAFWDLVEKERSVEIVSALPRGTFPKVSATSLLVRLGPRNSANTKPTSGTVPDPETLQKLQTLTCACIDVVRGRVQMHSLKDAGAIVHTRELSGPVDSTRRASLDPRAVEGRLLLLPRVGKPDVRKIRSAAGRLLLSDCVFALRPRLARHLSTLESDMVGSFDALASAYLGTGAPHLTLGRLERHLRTLGYAPRRVAPAKESPPCSCQFRTRSTAA